MKKLFILAICVVATFASCKKENINQSQNNQNQDDIEIVTFQFQPYQMDPMRGSKEVESSGIEDYCTRLDIYVFDTLDMENPVAVVHQNTSENQNFGTMSTVLQTNKYYTIYAVAHKCLDVATLNGDVIVFPEGKTTQSFFYKDTFTPANGLSKTCVMDRIVGMFKMETTDIVPDDVTKFTFVIDTIGSNWNVNGYSENRTERTVVFENFSTFGNGTVGFNVYLIGDDMENTTNVNIVATAYYSNGDVAEQRTFENVPIKNGWVTKYIGTFFVSFEMGFTFEANGWNEFTPVSYIVG